MKEHSRYHKLAAACTVTVLVVVLGLSLWIMLNHMGLAPGLDFAAGAYYYTDIPDYDKVIPESAYTATLPTWVYYALFFGWGYLMWRLWLRVSRDDVLVVQNTVHSNVPQR